MMMADSCESAIRAVKPQSNQDIADLVHGIIEDKRNRGQLDASMLTLNDLRKIEATFIDIFRGLFHPRIDYAKAVQSPSAAKAEPANGNGTRSKRTDAVPGEKVPQTESNRDGEVIAGTRVEHGNRTPVTNASDSIDALPLAEPAQQAENDNSSMIMEEDEPLFEVPPLPKRNGQKTPQHAEKGTSPKEADTSS